MGIQAVLVIVTICHIAAVGSGIFLTNLTDPGQGSYYGGETGIFPADDSPYGALTSFLAGDDLEVAAPTREGGFGVFRYVLTSGMCAGVDVTKMSLSLMTFNYPVVQIIPSEGFGLWVKLIIHALGILGAYYVLSKLVAFMVGAGILSNPYALGALGILAGLSIVGTIANGAGALAC